jgi:arsenate reductase-like glutaredoxin family protein
VETAETETAVETAETETAVETAETETAVETAAEKTLEDAVETKIEAQKESVKSQNTIDKLTDETGDMVQVYRNAIRKTDSLNSYNQQLAKLVKQQKLSLNSIQRQIENAEETRRSIVPFINKMITTLEKFVRLDLPFLLNERRQRVSTLKQIVDFPDITLPDKYRRVMEAYQIEIEYGRTIEAYNDTITVDGEEYTVEILRVGRLLMTFQTSDGELSGIWNKHSKAWRKLPSEYNRSINQGLLIAKKQAPPELIKLPVTAAGKKL